MTTLHVVYVQKSPTQVDEGFYTVTDGLLVMRYEDGKPVDEGRFTHRLKEGEDARTIAGRLTKQMRKRALGATIEGFHDPIHYEALGIA